LQEENKQAMTRVHALATIVTDQEQKYKDLREEKRLVEEECERYKKMFSEEKGKSIALYNQNKKTVMIKMLADQIDKNVELEVEVQRMRLQIGRGLT